MSSIKGGLFFKFIFGCWHSLTTLSINFHVFSSVFLSVDSRCGPHASEKAPWSLENIELMFFDCCMRLVRLVAIFYDRPSWQSPSSISSTSSATSFLKNFCCNCKQRFLVDVFSINIFNFTFFHCVYTLTFIFFWFYIDFITILNGKNNFCLDFLLLMPF